MFEAAFASLNSKLKGCDVFVISKQFSSLNTNLERVEYILKLDDIPNLTPFVKSSSHALTEYSQKSSELRNCGNEFFKKDQMAQALLKYTKSICYAPPYGDDSNCLALAYANRSAVLLRLKKYAEAMTDIELAMENHYPKNLLHKLLERKADCLRAGSKLEDAEKYYNEALTSCNVSHPGKQDMVKRIKEKLVSLGSENVEVNPNIESALISELIPLFQDGTCPTYPSLSSSCKVAFDNLKGRHIVASKDIKPGELILIEKPFASILVPEQFQTHCHFCLSCTINPLPCNTCVYSVFCSKECKSKATHSFHKYECPIMALLDASGLDKFSRLAIRAVLSVPINNICQMRKTNLLEPIDKEDVYSWCDYNAICGLVTNNNKRSAHDLFKRSAIAVFLLRMLEKTLYFDEVPSETDCNTRTCVGALLLSHLQSFPCNAHEIFAFQLSSESVLASKPIELGAGIYATLSLFNHSCDPAVTRHFYKDVCIVRAISTICKGSEISDNYGTVFQLHTKEDRMKHLAPQYCFDCRCQACMESWPTFAESLKKPPVWKCGNCDYSLRNDYKSASVDCQNCGCKQNLSVKKAHVIESEKAFNKAYDLLLSNRPQDAIPGICSYLNTLSQEISKPWNEFSRGQESLKHCYNMLANCCSCQF